MDPRPAVYRRDSGPLSGRILEQIRSGYRAAWFPTPPCSVTPSGMAVHVKPSCRCGKNPPPAAPDAEDRLPCGRGSVTCSRPDDCLSCYPHERIDR